MLDFGCTNFRCCPVLYIIIDVHQFYAFSQFVQILYQPLKKFKATAPSGKIINHCFVLLMIYHSLCNIYLCHVFIPITGLSAKAGGKIMEKKRSNDSKAAEVLWLSELAIMIVIIAEIMWSHIMINKDGVLKYLLFTKTMAMIYRRIHSLAKKPIIISLAICCWNGWHHASRNWKEKQKRTSLLQYEARFKGKSCYWGRCV